MAARRLAALFFAIAIAIVLPTIALAAVNTTGAGLVPCGVSSDYTTATECEACNLVQLIQGIINFLIGLSVPIAMGMFVWAGVLYFTAATNSENVGKAKRIFSSSALGFALALSSWIIVNTILSAVLDKDMYPNSSWFRVDCSTAPRQRTNEIGNIIGQYLQIIPPLADIKYTSFTPSYSCDESKGFVLVQMGSAYVCDNGTQKISPTITQTVNSGTQVLCPKGMLSCSPDEIMRLTGVTQARANAMSCIAVTESSGKPDARPDPRIFPNSSACGTFQILEKSNWNNPKYNSGACASQSCTNAECNIKVAITMGNSHKLNGGSYYSDWTCPGCNNKAAACVAKYDPGN